MKLPEELVEWTDWDWAGYVLARSTGLMDETVSYATDAKHVFWTNHPVGMALSWTNRSPAACSRGATSRIFSIDGIPFLKGVGNSLWKTG